MQTREFIDMAISLTESFHLMNRVGHRLSEAALQAYWLASRSRFDSWGHELKACRDDLSRNDQQAWAEWEPLIEEIYLSELPMRVWCTVLEELDVSRGLREYSPIARSVLGSHLEARTRALRWLIDGRDRGVEAAVRLNQLRLQAERWTDLLLAHFATDGPAVNFCHDVERWRTWSYLDHGRHHGSLAMLRQAAFLAFGQTAPIDRKRVVYYQQMHASLLALWGPEMFDMSGPPISAWQARLISLTHDTQGLLASWLDESVERQPPAERPTTPDRFQAS